MILRQGQFWRQRAGTGPGEGTTHLVVFAVGGEVITWSEPVHVDTLYEQAHRYPASFSPTRAAGFCWAGGWSEFLAAFEYVRGK